MCCKELWVQYFSWCGRRGQGTRKWNAWLKTDCYFLEVTSRCFSGKAEFLEEPQSTLLLSDWLKYSMMKNLCLCLKTLNNTPRTIIPPFFSVDVLNEGSICSCTCNILNSVILLFECHQIWQVAGSYQLLNFVSWSRMWYIWYSLPKDIAWSSVVLKGNTKTSMA